MTLLQTTTKNIPIWTESNLVQYMKNLIVTLRMQYHDDKLHDADPAAS